MLETIVEKLTDCDWLKSQRIDWSKKGEYYILNYNQFVHPTPYNVFTRSLIIHESGRIVSYPFVRFFNLKETSHVAKVDLDNSHIIEKVDGSFLGVVWDKGQMLWHSRCMLSSCQDDIDRTSTSFTSRKDFRLLIEAKKQLDQVNFVEEDHRNTNIFEFVTPLTKVITNYSQEQHGLYLIGCRNMETRQEKSEEELNEIAKRMGVRRPRIWELSYSEVMKLNFASDFEGFVIRDKENGNRAKVKLKPYLERHRLLSALSTDNLISLFCNGEREEIEAYFSDSKLYFAELQDKVENVVTKAVALIKNYQGIPRSILFEHISKLSRWEKQLIYWHIDVKEDDLTTKVRENIINIGKDHPHRFKRILKDFKVWLTQ